MNKLVKYYGNDLDHLVKEYFTIHIINVSVFGTRKVKEINLMAQYKAAGKNTWLDDVNMLKAYENVELNVAINDSNDICC